MSEDSIIWAIRQANTEPRNDLAITYNVEHDVVSFNVTGATPGGWIHNAIARLTAQQAIEAAEFMLDNLSPERLSRYSALFDSPEAKKLIADRNAVMRDMPFDTSGPALVMNRDDALEHAVEDFPSEGKQTGVPGAVDEFGGLANLTTRPTRKDEVGGGVVNVDIDGRRNEPAHNSHVLGTRRRQIVGGDVAGPQPGEPTRRKMLRDMTPEERRKVFEFLGPAK